MKLEKNYGELPYFNPLFHAEVARRMPENLKDEIFDMLSNYAAVNNTERNDNTDALHWLIDLKNTFGAIQYDDAECQAKIGEFFCGVFRFYFNIFVIFSVIN